jgi:ribose transport system substrate-binding protein
MKTALRFLIAVTLAGAVACGGGTGNTGAAGGASKPPATGKRKVIGVTLLTQTDAFYKALEAGIRQEAEAKGLDVVVVACEYDPTKQASQIEDFVAQHVAAILAAPCDSDAIVPALAGPERAAIPVFTADIAAHGGKIASHVASDNVQGGGLAADALAGFMGGKGKVIIIDHPTVASVQERVKGFEDAMKKYPGISIIAKPSADGQRAKAAQVMEDMLQAHRDIAGVFGINGPTALAAAGVVSAAGRKDIAVVGFDADEEVQAAVKSGGPLKATVVQSPDKIGQMTVDMIAKALDGQAVPTSVAVDVSIVK